MPKTIRAARHYQDRDSPVRRIADAGVAAIKRDVKQALMHLGTLVPDSALQFARAGDWHGLRREIAWGHFRQILKAPFARIGKVRESGAQLGARKINGAFAAKRRAVHFHKSSVVYLRKEAGHDVSDEPRDEGGRWTSGDGGGSSADRMTEGVWAAELDHLVSAAVEGMPTLNRALSGGNMDKIAMAGRLVTQFIFTAERKREGTSAHDPYLPHLRSAAEAGRRLASAATLGEAKAAAEDMAIHLSNLVTARHIEIEKIEAVGKDVGTRFTFDLYDQKTQDRIRRSQDDLIQQIEQEARDSIAEIVLAGAQEGLGPDEIVEDIRSLIGLTDRQTRAVLNYQKMLYELDPDALARRLRNTDHDQEIQDAIDSGEDLTDAAIRAMTADYAENYLDYRAETIAGTEATRAVNAGLQDAYSQAVDRGVFPADAVTQFWAVALDEKTCEICLSIPDMNPDGVGIDEPFESIDGQMDAPPDPHPACRCSLEIVTDLDKVPDEE